MRSLLDHAAQRSAMLLMLIAGAAITLMMLQVTADVAGKYLFRQPVPATFEMVEDYYMLMLVFLPFAYVARTERHIFVELFTSKLSPRALAALEAAVGLLTLAWVVLLAWYSGEEAVAMTVERELREISGGYLFIWPARWAVPLGCAAMALVVLNQLLKDFNAAIRRR